MFKIKQDSLRAAKFEKCVWLTIRVLKCQSDLKQIHVTGAKPGKICASEWWLPFALLFIRWESWLCCEPITEGGKAKPNQINV